MWEWSGDRTTKKLLVKQKFSGKVIRLQFITLNPEIRFREQEIENYVHNHVKPIYHVENFGPKFDKKTKMSGGHRSRVPNIEIKI